VSLILDWHLGLGDAIICNGLVRVLAERNSQIVLPVYHHNHASVTAMFSDLPNVMYQPVNADTNFPGALSIGVHNPGFGKGSGSFDQEMYRLAGVDFEHRWSSFKLPEAVKETQLEPPSEPYALIHQREGFLIRERPSKLKEVFVLPLTPCITDWVKMIASADEIHCIDSAFVHLVESVPSKGKLFFHSYARPNYFQRRKNWTVLE
jgi:hypothetical protein